MDPHIESVNPEPSVLDGLPNIASEEPISFEASLEAAFANLDAAASDPKPEPESPKTEQESPKSEPDVQPTETDEPLDSLTDEIDDNWTPKAANRFKQLKDELKTSRSELDDLRHRTTEYEARIKELTGLTEKKDYEQLQSKLAEYEQQKMFTDLEGTTAYQQAITEPLAALMEQASQVADKYDIDADALIDIIALDDPAAQEEQLSELLPNASDRDKARIFRIMEEVDPILQRRQQMYESADKALAEAKLLEEQRANAAAAERATLRSNVTRNVVERVTEKLPFLKSLEGLDMSAVEQRAASIDPAVIHPVDHAYNAVSAQLLPTIVREYANMRREVETLVERLAEYENAEPKVSGQTKSSASANGITDGMTFEQRVNAALGSI